MDIMVSSVAGSMDLAHHPPTAKRVDASERATARAVLLSLMRRVWTAPGMACVERSAGVRTVPDVGDGQALELRQRRQALVEALAAQRVLQAQLQPEVLRMRHTGHIGRSKARAVWWHASIWA